MAIKHFEHPCTAFGNGTLDADFDIDKDGNISGGAKGILTWDGKAENWK